MIENKHLSKSVDNPNWPIALTPTRCLTRLSGAMPIVIDYRFCVGMVWVGYRRSANEARELLEDPDGIDELLDSEDDTTSVDLDKSWHGLHWLLTGSEEPTNEVASEALFGGDPTGEDLGYGPARLLRADRVAAVAVALAGLDVDALRTRMDGAAMTNAGIYPGIWDEGDVFDTYLAPNYATLRDFYATAAESGESVIQTLC